VAIDLSGHGSSTVPEDGITFEHFIEDIERAFAEQGWEQADLFGYSMGGYAAMLFAARHPERVRSVITLGTKYLWTPEGLQKELRMLDPDAVLAKVPAFAQRLIDVHGEGKWRALVAAIAASMTDLARAPLLTKEVVDRITCRVLCCVGEEDTTAVPHDTRVFASGLRYASVVVLKGARHPFESVDMDLLERALSGSLGLDR
jgi:pimeloyl-ACP methyl ester carboxylesterase